MREQSWAVAYAAPRRRWSKSSPAMRLAATAAAFSEWLAASPYAQEVTLDELLRLFERRAGKFTARTRARSNWKG